MPAPTPPPAPGSATARRPLGVLFGFLRPHLWALGFALAALSVSAGALLALPIALRFVIDHGLSGRAMAEVDRSFAGLLGIALTYALFTGVRIFLLNWLGERVCADLRNAAFQRVLALDVTYFETASPGSILSRVMVDTTVIRTLAGSGLTVALRSSIILVGAVTMLAVSSPRLTAIVLVLIGPMLAPVLLLGRRVRRLARTAQDELAATGAVAAETLQGIRTVKSFTLEELRAERFAAAVQRSFAAAARRAGMRAVLVATSIAVLFGTVTFVLWLGVRSVAGGELTGGQLGQFLLYALFAAHSAVALTEAWGEFQRVTGASERLVEILALRPGIRSPSRPATPPAVAASRITFDHVGFSYPSRPQERALEDFCLEVAPAETIGLVGRSGAGKSTVVSLLQRFHDPSRGRILIDGVEIQSLDVRDLRSRIGLVPQETVIFAANARDNIRCGRPEATDLEVRTAARAALAEDFILELPAGYDTFLGEGGSRLSGGQRQRMAIARAILKDPPILVLDEATSMLDAESERLIRLALQRLMRDRTTLIIAHRLATLRAADRIVVLDRGRIAEVGRHDELVAGGSLYAHLSRLQLA